MPFVDPFAPKAPALTKAPTPAAAAPVSRGGFVDPFAHPAPTPPAPDTPPKPSFLQRALGTAKAVVKSEYKGVTQDFPSFIKGAGEAVSSAERAGGQDLATPIVAALPSVQKARAGAAAAAANEQKAYQALVAKRDAMKAAGQDTTAVEKALLVAPGAPTPGRLDSTLNEAELKNRKQVAGDFGQIGVDAIGAGTLGDGAAKILEEAPQLTKLQKAAELAKEVAKGATAGYGYDVTKHLQEDKKGLDIVKPGAGTVVGAVAPLALEGAGLGIKGASSFLGKNGAQEAAQEAEKIAPEVESRITTEPTQAAAVNPELKDEVVAGSGKGTTLKTAEEAPQIAETTPRVGQPAVEAPGTTKVTDEVAVSKGNPGRVAPVEVAGQAAPAETKVRGLAQGVEAKAIEKKLTTGFEGLPEYATVNMKDQADRAALLIKQDYEKAKGIALGRELPPEGTLPESVFVGVERKALADGDVNLLRDLATQSHLTAESTTMGQRIRTLAERDPESPVGAISDVAKARQEAAAARIKGGTANAVKKDVAGLKESIAAHAPTKQTWQEFVQGLEC